MATLTGGAALIGLTLTVPAVAQDRSPVSQAGTTVDPVAHTPAVGIVTLQGLDGRKAALTLEAIVKIPHQRVSLTHDATTTVYEGPLLSDLLRDIDAPLGVRFHSEAATDVVVVRARDGYRVVLSLGELDPAVHAGAKVILADRADGKPLDDHDGPLRLVVDGDAKPARSERQVADIMLEHLP